MDTTSLITTLHAALAAPFIALLAAWFILAMLTIVFVASGTRH